MNRQKLPKTPKYHSGESLNPELIFRILRDKKALTEKEYSFLIFFMIDKNLI